MNWSPILQLIALLCLFHISYFWFVMIKMSKTIQLSWAIDYSDPHFSGNGKSFNQDQARSKIFKSPSFLCRFYNVEYEVRHFVLYPTAELQEREAKKMWKSGPILQMVQLTSLNVWLDLSKSLLRFRDKGKLFAISHPFQLGDCLVIRLRVPEEW